VSHRALGGSDSPKTIACKDCCIPQAIDGPDLTDAEMIDRDLLNIHDDNAGDPALWLVLKESEAKKIVAALENGHAYEVVAILKSQVRWPELSAAVRGLRYSIK
jgi:hypothetical protein